MSLNGIGMKCGTGRDGGTLKLILRSPSHRFCLSYFVNDTLLHYSVLRTTKQTISHQLFWAILRVFAPLTLTPTCFTSSWMREL